MRDGEVEGAHRVAAAAQRRARAKVERLRRVERVVKVKVRAERHVRRRVQHRGRRGQQRLTPRPVGEPQQQLATVKGQQQVAQIAGVNVLETDSDNDYENGVRSQCSPA